MWTLKLTQIELELLHLVKCLEVCHKQNPNLRWLPNSRKCYRWQPNSWFYSQSFKKEFSKRLRAYIVAKGGHFDCSHSKCIVVMILVANLTWWLW